MELAAITEITLPTMDKMDMMCIEELRYWRTLLQPFYYERSLIAERYGTTAYSKAIRYLWFDRMIKNIELGIDRWERVDNSRIRN